MAAISIGNIGEFKPQGEEWANYKRRLEIWMKANKIEDDNMANAFLAIVGADTFDLVSALIAPIDIETSSYNGLIEALDRYYKPVTSGMAKRVVLRSRKQKEGESISDYIVELKKLSRDCQFTPAELIPNLRDAFAAGLRSQAIQQKLFEVGFVNLTWERAQSMALSMESAYNDSGSLHNKFEKPNVNRIINTEYRKKRENVQPAVNNVCGRCLGIHHANDCPYINSTCFNCGKRGHVVSGCRQRKRTPSFNKHSRFQRTAARGNYSNPRGRGQRSKNYYGSAHCVDEDIKEELNTNCITNELSTLFMVDEEVNRLKAMHNGNPEVKVEVSIRGEKVKFTLDTAASVTVLPEDIYHECFSDIPLQSCNVKLRGYSGSSIPIIGEIHTDVVYNDMKYDNLRIIIVEGSRQPLLGREWLQSIKLNWNNLFAVLQSDQINDVLSRYKSVFEFDPNRFITPYVAQIKICESSMPIFCRPRPVAYAIKESVEKEIDRLVSSNVLVKVETSDWASPIVVVPKKTPGVVRICGDYKVSVNRVIEEEPYSFPTTEDLFTRLTGGIIFSKLDLSNAYLQLPLDPESKKLLTINTHLGLYQYQKLPLGVSTAPAIFQKCMDKILCGLDRVCCKIDDILISARSEVEHIELLSEVLSRLDRHGITLGRDKCDIGVTKLEYLGHIIDKDGLHPTPDKVLAITNAKIPTNVSELRSLLGVYQYYSHFLPNLSTVLSPLYHLLGKDTEWSWTPECTSAVNTVKKYISSDKLLVHYSSDRKLILACDASSVGIGAVISHIMDNGQERPIAYASRTLSAAEKNYSQIEREALSIIFGVRKFHKYLYGRKFILITDHKPLTTLFNPKTGIPTLSALRMQRWSLILSAYQYEICYRKSSDHGNADMLSRLPLENVDENLCELEINYFTYTNDLPITALDICNETKKDPILCKVWRYVMHGWPEYCDDVDLDPYFRRRNELSIDNGCILWGLRVIVPPKYRDKLLNELHREHLGIVRMKAVARSYFWFPNLDMYIESLVSKCTACVNLKNVPNSAPIFSWKVPSKPWERVHVDFFELNGMNYLLLVDTYSKWLEIQEMKLTTASKTIEVLGSWFARFGLPCEIVSDNGPQFSSFEYREFMSNNGIKCTYSPPYHPSSNGAAERSVQTVKNSLKKHLDQSSSKLSLNKCISSFLFSYRNTPHTVTNRKPSELLLSREVRTRFTLLRPDIQRTVDMKQSSEIAKRNVNRKVREFIVGEKVRVLNVRNDYPKWFYGKIVSRLSPVRYIVKIGYRERQVHVDHIRETFEDNILPKDHLEPMIKSDDVNVDDNKTSQSDVTDFRSNNCNNDIDNNLSVQNSTCQSAVNGNNSVRRSGRITKQPERLIESI